MGVSNDNAEGCAGTVPVCKACGSARVARDARASWSSDSARWKLESILDGALCHHCGRATSLVWKSKNGVGPAAIRELNDRFRKEGRGLGSVLVTAGIQGLGSDFVGRVLLAVRGFDAFTEDNDPWNEHDFGAVEVNDEKVFWKIDYYDPTLTAGSPDPANEKRTHRVLTIMLASEY